MKQVQRTRKGLLIEAALACLALAVWSGSASAQGGTTGTTGGTTGGTGTTAGGGGAGAGAAAAGGTTVFGTGGTGGATTTGKTTGTSPIQKSNALLPYYASPMNAGWGPNVTLKSQAGLSFDAGGASSSVLVTGKGNFGVAMLAPTTTTTTAKGATGTAKGGAKGGAAMGTTAVTSTTSTGFNTTATKRTSGSYITKVDPGVVLPPMAIPQVQSQMQSNLGGVLTQAPTLQTHGLNVQVDTNQVVVLQGVVQTEAQRRLAEGLMRLEPGVRTIRNDIVVVGGEKK